MVRKGVSKPDHLIRIIYSAASIDSFPCTKEIVLVQPFVMLNRWLPLGVCSSFFAINDLQLEPRCVLDHRSRSRNSLTPTATGCSATARACSGIVKIRKSRCATRWWCYRASRWLVCDEWLGLWLYSLARAECLRREAVAPGDADEQVALPHQDDADSRLMAWKAVTSMPSGEVGALELDSGHEVDVRRCLACPRRRPRPPPDRSTRHNSPTRTKDQRALTDGCGVLTDYPLERHIHVVRAAL